MAYIIINIVIVYQLNWLDVLHKVSKMLSVCAWMLTRVEQIVTVAHRHL